MPVYITESINRKATDPNKARVTFTSPQLFKTRQDLLWEPAPVRRCARPCQAGKAALTLPQLCPAAAPYVIYSSRSETLRQAIYCSFCSPVNTSVNWEVTVVADDTIYCGSGPRRAQEINCLCECYLFIVFFFKNTLLGGRRFFIQGALVHQPHIFATERTL